MRFAYDLTCHSLFLKRFQRLFTNSIQSATLTFRGACRTNVTSVENQPVVCGRDKRFRDVFYQLLFSCQRSGTRAGNQSDAMAHAEYVGIDCMAALLNTTLWITFAVLRPTPGSLISSSSVSGTVLWKSRTSICAIPTRCLALLLG